MTREKEKKVGKDQLLLEASRLGRADQLEAILNQLQMLKMKKRTNPLASLRKTLGPNNIRDPVTGFTCLHHAALNGHAHCVKLILEHGAKVNAVDYKGSSALHLAAWAGNLEVVRLLLAQVPAGNLWQRQVSAGNELESPKNEQIAVDLCNNDNQTPLSLAAQFGHAHVVAELLGRGASPQLRNSQLESALDLACLNGRLETVDLLLRSEPALVQELRRARATALLPAQAEQPLRLSGELAQEEVGRPSSIACGVGDSPSAAGHTRRPSAGGWSSLLRGRRDSAGSGAQSPLHRLTAATLSMRQKNNSVGGGSASEPVPEESPSGGRGAQRRATLTVGAAAPFVLEQQQQQQQQQLYNNRQALFLQEQAASRAAVNAGKRQEERLLEHSPLHLATRRGHAQVARLLLVDYQANLMQVSALGGVLHEVALNNGKHSDMIGFFFHFIERSVPQERRLGFLEQFLNLRDAHNKSVFEVLSEINNRSAQEIKRLIYEFAEQLAASSELRAPHNLDSSQPFERQFSDMHQINSFVTMKRAPKLLSGAQTQRAPLADASQLHLNQPLAAGTQTVDRRSQRQQQHQQQQQQQQLQQQQLQQDQLLAARLRSQPAGWQQQHMTRSVSNLNRQLNRCEQQDEQLWRQWLAREPQAGDFLNHSCDQPINDETRRRRSKSRELGSLLREQPAQARPSCSPFENAPPGSQNPQLVRSQTDCSHLMGRLFEPAASSGANPLVGPPSAGARLVGQPHACLDRKTINRHYHVYEHEFYPPRLLGQTEVGVASGVGSTLAKQLAAGGLARAAEPGGWRASTRSTLSSQSAHTNELARGRQMAPAGCPLGMQQAASANSRLSLNMESANEQLLAALGQMSAGQQQQAPMDRFVGRHQAARRSQAEASNEQARRELLDLQRRLVAEQQQQQQQQQQQLHNSYSLESHLSEPHLFESTRQALMHDFDQLIGRELLNRNHRSIIEQQPTSVLEGVSLDMDRYGERLTVSGTRVFVPEPAACAQKSAAVATPPSRRLQKVRSSESGSQRSSSSRSSDASLLAASEQLSSSLLSGGRQSAATQTGDQLNASNSSSSLGTQTNEEPDEGEGTPEYPAEAPAKPPRLSLLRAQKRAAQAQRALIYDLPEPTTPTCSASGSPGSQETAAKPRRASAQQGRKMQRGAALTEPPREKPPPPPPAQASAALLSSPLHVNASEQNHAQATPSCNSNSSSTDSASLNNGAQSECGGLLKLASLTSNSSSGSGSSASRPPNRLALLNQRQQDPDSGICTSNSPASMSHDSEEPLTECEAAIALSVATNSAPRRSKQPAQTKPALPTATPSRPIELELEPGEIVMAPPSPNTAQLCVEEALMPITKMSETANQMTSPLMSGDSFNVATVDRWLSTEPVVESEYENCHKLQEQLRSTRCRSIGNLLSKLQTAQSPTQSSMASASTLASPSARAEEEGDYATQSLSDHSSSRASSDEAESEQASRDSRKEVMLRVVVDGSQPVDNETADEVFYINPLELKKITTKRRSQRVDAETLTDEELCAAIDQESGFIRFTLRKRRNPNGETCDKLKAEQSCGSTQLQEAAKLEQGSKPQQASIKRTKLETEENCSRNSSPELPPNTPNSSRRPPRPPPPTVGLQTQGKRQQELNNNNQSQPETSLERWFGAKLAGLVELADNFKRHGFDEPNFLNHPALLNEDLLKQMRIEDFSHRQLILARVSELPRVELEALLAAPAQEAKLTAERAFERLKLSHLFEGNAKDAVEALRGAAKEAPLGHKVRLEAAAVELERRKVAAPTLAKQASSDSSEVEMDTSQTSSSSSKESVKSIVSLKALVQPDAFEEAAKEEPTKAEGGARRELLKEERARFSAQRPSSLVSEATRKLELAALANAAPKRPVAAARKINGLNKATDEHGKTEKASSPTKTAPNARKSSPIQRKSPLSGFVPVKAVCWPPKSAAQQQQAKAQTEERADAEKELEERRQVDEISFIKSARAKPAPPAKPPKLVAAAKLNSVNQASHKL